MNDTRAHELIECIRFYADPANYVASVETRPSRVNADGGLRARSFLTQFAAAE